MIQDENETKSESLLVMERVYLGVGDLGDAKNPESKSESAPRCTRRDTQEQSHTQMVWGWESIGKPTQIHVHDNTGQKLH
jgi:hypothetical protein